MDLITDTVRISHEFRIGQNLCLHTTIRKELAIFYGKLRKRSLAAHTVVAHQNISIFNCANQKMATIPGFHARKQAPYGSFWAI
jgi:hypothetical protein